MVTTLNWPRKFRRLYPRPPVHHHVNAACAHLFAALVETAKMSTWSRIQTPMHLYRTRA